MPVQYKDYYKILGVPRDASKEQVAKAYRELARKYHPDRNKDKGAEDKLKEINEAYAVLKDADKRRKYDQLGAGWQSGQEFHPPPGWDFGSFGAGGFRGGRVHQGGTGGHFDFGGFGGGGFSDFFEALFGRGGDFGGMPGGVAGGVSQSRSADTHAEISIPLADAYHGAKRTFTLETQDPRAGRSTRRAYDVKIPAGVADGDKIRLSGQGQSGPNGAAAGDLILKVKIEPHPFLRVKGRDLETDVAVSPWEAALGGEVPVRTLDGAVAMTLPAGAQSGQRMRLRGKGLPHRGGAERGDLFAIIKIVVPKRLTPKERDLLEQLRKISPFNPREA